MSLVLYRTSSFLLVFVLTSSVTADDWPQWRGKNRDASLGEKEQLDSLPTGDIPIKWSVPVGGGYSAPSVADGRVYVTDRPSDVEKEVERVICVDEQTGKEIWTHTYPAPYTISYKAGPRAAVTIDKGKAFSVGAMGHFFCFDAATGDVLWKRDLNADYNIKMPIWGITASPLVYKDLVIQIAAGSGDNWYRCYGR